MKIGTKANAIDDLGKFDGSKMTIKVNGKQIYPQKRYAIVRVDNRCPVEEEEDICLVDRIKMFPCFNDKRLSCKKCNYGDIKEQFISKVEQIIRRPIQKGDLELKSKGFKYGVRRLAKEIVEFLGVE